MKEYGGYIELDKYHLDMLHNDAIALNCGRNALAYLIISRNIKKIKLPFLLCDCIYEVCYKYHVEVTYYHICSDFTPEDVSLEDNQWLYVINYYGQISESELQVIVGKYGRVIVDNAQAYFDTPLDDVDTLYTCRKFFGVSDGAFLYTNSRINYEYPIDESFERMHYLLGRFERTASEFYSEYVANNDLFTKEPIKRMSMLTDNLLHGIDYEMVKKRRTENFKSYQELLGSINQLELKIVEGAFAYPLLIQYGSMVRGKLQKRKIYVPTLWPNVLEEVNTDFLEYRFASSILPLPCDQRYCKQDIDYICSVVIEILNTH